MIKLLALDVDGVLTDGKIILSGAGELKNFSVKDGFGIKLAQKAGIEVCIITGRFSDITAKRAHELGIVHLYNGVDDKFSCFSDICNKLNVDMSSETAYMGDDLNDMKILKSCFFSGTVSDAPYYIKKEVDFVSQSKGGDGAVREFIEAILVRNGKWEEIFCTYF